jgi:hypothetical protein
MVNILLSISQISSMRAVNEFKVPGTVAQHNDLMMWLLTLQINLSRVTGKHQNNNS